MNLQAIFERTPTETVRAGLVGAGEFGLTFIAQARNIAGLSVPAICDRDPRRVFDSLVRAGHAPDSLALCGTPDEAREALAAGRTAIVPDNAFLSALPLDVIVEATGDPEGAARVLARAIDDGRHTVVVTKEAEIVVGPILARRAEAAGVVHTLVDGDQPSLLVGLVGWARLLGLSVVAAGKASESDFVWHEDTGEVHAWGRALPAPGGYAAFDAASPDTSLARRATVDFARTTVPDLCEMGIVANHTGLVPDTPDLHAPIARTTELPNLFRPATEGGLLRGTGIVDIFNCLRRPDEISFAGGVFIVAEAPDATTGKLLAAKGIPTSEDGRHVLIHNPVHLLGAEAPMSVLSAARLRCSTGGTTVAPHFDLIGRAARDLEAGETLALGERHAIEQLDHQLAPAAPLSDGAAVPYYLAAGCRLRRAVRAGAVLTCGDVELDEDRTLYALRVEQDAVFHGGSGD